MTIASALDKLNDKLAGSDQPASQTIEGMILRLIDNIDAGGGGSLPIASADTLGGIKVGENLSITEGGVLSASGGGGGALVVGIDENYTLDKTFAEILAAAQTSAVLLFSDDEDGHYSIYSLCEIYTSPTLSVGFEAMGDSFAFVAETEDSYPVLDNQGD